MQVYSTFTPQESLFFQLALFLSLRGTLFWINTRSHIEIAHCRIALVTSKTELYKNNLWDPSLTYIIWITLTENKWLPKRYSRYWSVRGLLHVYRRALQRYTSNSNSSCILFFVFWFTSDECASVWPHGMYGYILWCIPILISLCMYYNARVVP